MALVELQFWDWCRSWRDRKPEPAVQLCRERLWCCAGAGVCRETFLVLQLTEQSISMYNEMALSLWYLRR